MSTTIESPYVTPTPSMAYRLGWKAREYVEKLFGDLSESRWQRKLDTYRERLVDSAQEVREALRHTIERGERTTIDEIAQQSLDGKVVLIAKDSEFQQGQYCFFSPALSQDITTGDYCMHFGHDTERHVPARTGYALSRGKPADAGYLNGTLDNRISPTTPVVLGDAWHLYQALKHHESRKHDKPRPGPLRTLLIGR